MSAACVLFLPLLRLLIIRAASAPAVPAAAAAAHSAAQLLWPRGLSAAAKSEPRRAAPQNKGLFHATFLKKNGQLRCHNNQWVQPDGTM